MNNAIADNYLLRCRVKTFL